MTNVKNVIMIQDGAVDELLSVYLLQSMPDINLSGIMVVNADCQGYPTAVVINKLLALTATTDVPVAVSKARGWNAFPWTYRQYSLMVNLLPMVNQYQADVVVPEPIMDLTLAEMVDSVYQSSDGQSVTLLCLSPITDIAHALMMDSQFAAKVAEIVWMGGVYITEDTPAGNIDTGIAPGANPNAEWNVYWDPSAARQVINSGIPIKMFPLNVTNQVELSGEIIRKYFLPDSGEYPSLNLASQLYSYVAFQYGFSFWDTAATAYLGKRDLYTLQKASVKVSTSPHPAKQGTMKVDFISPDEPLESAVEIATTIDVTGFYDYYVQQLKTLTFVI